MLLPLSHKEGVAFFLGYLLQLCSWYAYTHTPLIEQNKNNNNKRFSFYKLIIYFLINLVQSNDFSGKTCWIFVGRCETFVSITLFIFMLLHYLTKHRLKYTLWIKKYEQYPYFHLNFVYISKNAFCILQCDKNIGWF